MKVKVEVSGLEDVRKTLTDLAPRMARNLLRTTARAIAAEVVADAKSNIKSDTGRLKKAIKLQPIKSNPNVSRFAVFITHGPGVKDDAFYWRYIEYGTYGKKGRPAAPFIGPAAAKMRSSLNARVREHFGVKLQKALAKEAKKNGV